MSEGHNTSWWCTTIKPHQVNTKWWYWLQQKTIRRYVRL